MIISPHFVNITFKRLLVWCCYLTHGDWGGVLPDPATVVLWELGRLKDILARITILAFPGMESVFPNSMEKWVSYLGYFSISFEKITF